VKAGIAFAAQMSLNLAVGALNPVVLATTIAVAGLAAGYTMYASEQQKAAREAENFALQMKKQKEGADGALGAAEQQARITAELTVLYQRLDYVQRRASGSSETLALGAQSVIDVLETPIDPGAEGWWEAYRDEAERISDAMAMLSRDGQGNLRKILFQTAGWAEAVAAQSAEQMLAILKSLDLQTPEARAEISRIQKQIDDLVNEMNASPPAENSEIKKAWQKWFGEITGIDPALFGSSGAMAAELYLKGFSDNFNVEQTVSRAIGTDMNIADMFRGEQKEIQKALTELLAIDASNIDQPFTVDDTALTALIRRFRELGEAIHDIEYHAAIEGLQKKIDDLGKSENNLALEAAKDKGATEDQLAALKALMDEYDRKSVLQNYERQVEELTKDKYDLARASFAAAGATEEEKQELEEYIAALQKAEGKSALEEARQGLVDWQQSLSDTLTLALLDIEGFSGQAAAALGDLGAQFIGMLPPAAIEPLKEFGRAMAEGEDAAKAMRQALAEQAQQILDQLPMMLLQAGLQLIIKGQWPLGLGLIAAAGSSAIIAGWTGGMINKAQEDADAAAKENAKGGVYGELGRAAREYAAGGVFTNRIVSRPTYFRYGDGFSLGLGLMGEAGPEAVMPLARGGDGRLGVSAVGAASGGTAVYVIIQNYTNEEVRAEESSDSGGNQVHKIIIGAVKQSISSGEMDQSMSSRYGLRARGV
jgi:hypothetical protein